VAGYSGGDVAPDLDEVVVREANAHAWVEVWLGDDRGWVLFDPTPPASVPQLGGASGLDRIRWAWQQLELLWDRRLLTFGLGEQIDLIDGLSAAMARARGLVRRPIVLIWIAAAVALIAVAVPGWLWWRRWIRPWRSTSKPSRGPASRAVIRLARALIPVGGIVPPSATVRSIGSQAVDFWPQAQVQIGELVRRAEDELYGDHGPTTGDAAEVKRLWKSIRSRMKNREIEIEG